MSASSSSSSGASSSKVLSTSTISGGEVDLCSSTKNAFALALHFYALYFRQKLIDPTSSTDLLDKIAKKYRTKSQSLVSDLQKKYYYYKVAEEVSVWQLVRYSKLFAIPSSFLSLLPSLPSQNEETPKILTYDAKYDVLSASFDAEAVLSDSMLISPSYPTTIFDNLSKVTHLLPGENGTKYAPIAMPSTEVSSISKAKSSMAVEVEDKRHLLEIIADISTPIMQYRNDKGEKIDIQSPLYLVRLFMKNKDRVRIILRRRNSVRGSIDAFIKGFDKYFNLLLHDVDEEYITNKVHH